MASLLSTAPTLNNPWIFEQYNLTGPSNLDDVNRGVYGKISSVQEFVFGHFGNFVYTEKECLHVVVDDILVTAQRKADTLIALQTFILICNK
jgi:hypothetical protein